MIKFDHVHKQYGANNPALRDINLTIGKGEFVFLIGPSGAGKTTLLKLLLRDIVPTKGEVIVDDTNLKTLSAHKVFLLRRKIGMVFQDFKLLYDRTVQENVSIALEILNKKPREIEKDVRNMLSLVGLYEKRDLFPSQLSAGEMQRAGIARAIIAGPKILLADEPTGNLDPKTAWEVLYILQEVNKIGTTVIMATHNVSVVNDLKKRTITIVDGAVLADDPKGRYHLPDTSGGEK
ncbi:cell division ATP-binding protein FtsE [Candidatus Gottesmanbacteria bacterium RBG_16_52_11]|uniref:Cell division ATP-binding protein FtsE n=1 Tax=Candidatus Gottesmanbacteria bacterium RBG_16_52_11 TaxID=1798374 RepID=A0A1F5YMU7_9BACT|nr:MAG: cell division ATP-binding protein FtsE [Candidatus Gottesmanbacteria bacterium RBG_16_52_11]